MWPRDRQEKKESTTNLSCMGLWFLPTLFPRFLDHPFLIILLPMILPFLVKISLTELHPEPKQNIPYELTLIHFILQNSICSWLVCKKDLSDEVRKLAKRDFDPIHLRPNTIIYISSILSPLPFSWCSLAPQCFYYFIFVEQSWQRNQTLSPWINSVLNLSSFLPLPILGNLSSLLYNQTTNLYPFNNYFPTFFINTRWQSPDPSQQIKLRFYPLKHIQRPLPSMYPALLHLL